MSQNAFYVRVNVPKSDGFHTRNDHQATEIVCHHLRKALQSPMVPTGCDIRVVRQNPANTVPQAAVKAIAQLETLLAQWEGSDWAYTQPVQEIKRIVAAAKSGQPLIHQEKI